MNILASYNWIKEYLQTDATPEEFAKEMSLKSMSVESIECLKNRFENIVIGEVKELKSHPNADRLKVALTDIGDKEVEIVCGGQNLCSGMKVVVALPGSRVLWHGEGELVELTITKVRGVESYGMICAPSELGFAKAPCPEGGIWDVSDLTEAGPGISFVQAMDMDDVLFDIEVTSNRVDSMSIVGLAREGGVVTQGAFTFKQPEDIEHAQGKDLLVRVDDPDLCPRYMAVVISGIEVGPSPQWLQNKLLLSGHRPINNIVDITNYILHEYGQPLHAFDYETLSDKSIVVRRAREGDQIKALDENTYKLKTNQLVIADGEHPIAVAGVMGGEPTGTSDKTTTVVFEAAVFDPISVRQTSRALNLYSDSQVLFEKGLSVQSPELALKRAVELTKEITGGCVASQVFDVCQKKYEPYVFPWRSQKTRDIIGIDLSDKEMIDILEQLGCIVDGSKGEYSVTVPYWRDHDIEAEIDFTEEIARVYGYHNIPAVLPDQVPPAIFKDAELAWEDRTKNVFSSNGYTEFYGYSFVSCHDLERYDLDPSEALELHNPLSSELTHLRTSLIPSVLKDIEMNQGEVSSGWIFELQRVYKKQKDDLPKEQTELVFGVFGIDDVQQTFLEQKGMIEHWAKCVGVELSFKRINDDVRWHPTRSVGIFHNGRNVGILGQVAGQYQDAYKIERSVVLAKIDFFALVKEMKSTLRYESIPEFPAIVRDIAIEVDEHVEFEQVKKVLGSLDPLIKYFGLKEVYKGQGVLSGKKSMTLTIALRCDDRTLSSQEADAVVEKIEHAAVGQLGAKMR